MACSTIMAALQGWPAARVWTSILRLSSVPAPRAAFPSARTLGTRPVACSAAADPQQQPPVQGAQLVSGGGGLAAAGSRRKGLCPGSLHSEQHCLPTDTVPPPLQMRKKKRRLDEICLERHPEHSRNVIQSWIVQGGWVGGWVGGWGGGCRCCCCCCCAC